MIDVEQSEQNGAVGFGRVGVGMFVVGPSALNHGVRMVSGSATAMHPQAWPTAERPQSHTTREPY